MAITSQKTWTYQDYRKLDDDKRYEIIAGELFEMPSPQYLHQKILKKLARKLDDYVEERLIGEICIAPLDVIFNPTNVYQPDILFISNNNSHIIKDKIFGTPDLLIEILSPSNPDLDKQVKFKLYEQFAVQGYWLIDTQEKTISIFCLENNILTPYCQSQNNIKIRSKIFNELKLSFQDLEV